MDTIGKIVYINLEKRADRRAEIEGELKRMGLKGERFAAVEYIPGSVGCSLSHAAVVRAAAEEGVSSLLVLEDDFYWTVQSRAELDQRLRALLAAVPDYDVIMFDYCVDKDLGPVAEGVGRVGETTTTSGYLVAGHYLDRLATNFEEGARLFLQQPYSHWIFSVDVYWKRLQTDKWYYPAPRFGTQRDGFSDIGNNYKPNGYATQHLNTPK